MFRGDGIGIGGNKESIVFEACEYKDHFLKYKPDVHQFPHQQKQEYCHNFVLL